MLYLVGTMTKMPFLRYIIYGRPPHDSVLTHHWR